VREEKCQPMLRIRIRRILMFLGLPAYVSRSGSFYHQAKIVRKILITTVLFDGVFITFPLWKMM
jgi:hypothetical protein